MQEEPSLAMPHSITLTFPSCSIGGCCLPQTVTAQSFFDSASSEVQGLCEFFHLVCNVVSTTPKSMKMRRTDFGFGLMVKGASCSMDFWVTKVIARWSSGWRPRSSRFRRWFFSKYWMKSSLMLGGILSCFSSTIFCKYVLQERVGVVFLLCLQ